MSWIRRYRLRLYFRNAIWILPIVSIIAGLLAVVLLSRFERGMGWQMSMSLENGRVVMITIATSMFSLVVVGSSAILVTVQLAGAQITPRIISVVYTVPARKIALAVFVFTFTFSVGVLARIEGSVPLLTGYVAAYGFLLNLALFIYFIDRIGKTLRPGAVLQYVALIGRNVIRAVYPEHLDEQHVSPPASDRLVEGEPTRVIANAEDGVLLAFDLKGLVNLAERSNCLIELIPEVGDFVAAGDSLFRIFHGGEALSEDALQDSVALGQERTMEQDPMFSFRIIVDVALKALSPAINDPTTAVLAIDQIHHLLREVGSRHLAEGQETDRAGQLRLVYRTPNWEHFVLLAVTEIRQYGRESIQVTRRLRAMLENLIATLPDRRAAQLRKELSLLASSSRRAFPDPDDQELAETSDLQGMGGKRIATRGGLKPAPRLRVASQTEDGRWKLIGGEN
jgi:uncharacterized membrane protein